MINVKMTADGQTTTYSYQILGINGDVIGGGSECHKIGFFEDYAPAGMTGLAYYTQYHDALDYEQISRDVLQSMLDAQKAEIERIFAAGVSPFHLVCHRSQFPALAAIERAIVSYADSMHVKC